MDDISTETEPSLRTVVARLRTFAAIRNWDQFHTPKNLAMAVAGEAGELLAEYQWLTIEEAIATREATHPQRRAIESEVADVFIYLTRLADVLDIDLVDVALQKIEVNEARFPPVERP